MAERPPSGGGAPRPENGGAGQDERPVVDEFGQELTDALRAELSSLQEELAGRAREAAKGTGLLAAAGVAGAVSGAALLSLPLIVARRLLPPGMTALLAAAGSGAACAYLTKRGREELGAARPAEADQLKAAVRDAARRATGAA